MKPPMAWRIRRRVGKPMAAVMRRTCRFLPSSICSSIHVVGCSGGTGWGRALPGWVVVWQEPCFGGPGGEDLAFGFEWHGALQLAEVFRRGCAFDLDVIGLPDFAAAVAFEDAAL